MTAEMIKFRMLLDNAGIEWRDASALDDIEFPITRTHFVFKGYHWSVIHGRGTYGGINSFNEGRDEGLLELMSNAVNEGDPIGWLTAEDAMQIIFEAED